MLTIFNFLTKKPKYIHLVQDALDNCSELVVLIMYVIQNIIEKDYQKAMLYGRYKTVVINIVFIITS